jgi:hypothetical protein
VPSRVHLLKLVPVPKLNAFPHDNSVVVLDNVRVQRSVEAELRALCNSRGALLVFLPCVRLVVPYTPWRFHF